MPAGLDLVSVCSQENRANDATTVCGPEDFQGMNKALDRLGFEEASRQFRRPSSRRSPAGDPP